MHFENIHCHYNPTNQYHVLIDVSGFSADFLKKTKPCSVSCLFTTFRYLFSFSDTLEAKGDVFKNSCWQWSTTKLISTDTQKQTLVLPYKSVFRRLRKTSQINFNNQNACNETFNRLEVDASKQKNQPTQTDQLTTETLKRVQSILSGPHVGAFCQVMDIFISGYGNLEIGSDVSFVHFLREEKIKFWKKMF